MAELAADSGQRDPGGRDVVANGQIYREILRFPPEPARLSHRFWACFFASAETAGTDAGVGSAIAADASSRREGKGTAYAGIFRHLQLVGF